jgi:PAS domain S-box-containing protein
MMLDVIRWMAMEIGFQPVFTDMSFAEAQEAVLAGEADIITSLFRSEKREQRFVFTPTLFEVPASIFVRAQRTDISTLADLNGKVIAMQRGDYAEEFLSDRDIEIRIRTTLNFASAVDLVVAGKADALVGDEQIVLYHVFSNRLSDRIKKVGDPLYIGKNCLAGNKDNRTLVGILSKGVIEARKAGILDKISRKWLGRRIAVQPSWFERHGPWVAGGAACVLVLAVLVWVWNMRLRTVVRQRTEEIRLREHALRSSEQRYRVLAENSLTGIFIHQDEKLVYVNSRVASSLGYHPREIVGRRLRDFVDSPDQDFVQEQVRGGSPGQSAAEPYQMRVRTRWGTVRWIEVLATDIEHEGRPAVLANAIDVTERKHAESERRRAEEALRESEARYRDLFENANDIIYTHDLDGNYTWANSAVTRVLGYGVDEFCSLNTRDIVADEHLPTAVEMMRRKVEDSSLLTGPYELRVRARDGTPLWFEVTSRVMTEDGVPVGVHGTARDVTARKLAEEARRESEEKYRLVVHNANEAIVVAQKGMLVFVNPRAVQLFGYREEELLAQPFADFIHADERDMVAKRHHDTLESPESATESTFRIIDRWGGVKWVEANAVAVTWNGEAAVLNFLDDISTRKRFEDELGKLEKLESLGILAGGLAHDFNNFLTSILGNIALARISDADSEKLAKRLAEAERACLQAQGLTQQLLTFSKGGAPVKTKEYIPGLIENSCEFAARGSNVACAYDFAEDLHVVDVDVGQIGQAVHNLVLNAVHAMPQGGTLRVGGRNLVVQQEDGLPLQPGKYVVVTIRDEGVGIPEKILPRIFDPYFTTKQTGSGLGLATAYSVIKNHDGLLTVESQVAIGTTFRMYLPAGDGAPPVEPPFHRPPATASGSVLLMDDNEAVRLLGADMLEELGYNAAVAADGKEAVALYGEAMEQGRPFDVVILDLTVPGGMGGLETIETLKRIDPQVKAIVSSGYSTDSIMADFQKHGFAGVVPKPYTPEQLTETLNHVMADHDTEN